MKKYKKIFQKIIICTLFLTVLITLNPIYKADENIQKTLYVKPESDNGNYSSIQQAVDNASENDTIYVFNGIYHENIIINKSLKITGEDNKKTVIDGDKKSFVILLNKNDIFISNLKIQNSNFGLITIGDKNISNNTVLNNVISNNSNGVFLQNSSCKNLIKNNSFENNKEALQLYQSSENKIVENNFIDIGQSAIILKEKSKNNIIENNNITGCSKGILVFRWSNDNSIKYNKLTKNDKAILIKKSYYNKIFGNDISYNTGGINLEYSKYNNVSKNYFSKNTKYAVYFVGSDNNVIYNDNIFLNNNEDIKEKTRPFQTPGFEFVFLLAFFVVLMFIKKSKK